MNCARCEHPIEEARVEYGFTVCSKCAHEGFGQPAPVKGVMCYHNSKGTGAEIMIMSEDSFNRNKKYFQPNGARSCVKNFSKNICR